MTEEDWLSILSRITQQEPLDLDTMLSGAAKKTHPALKIELPVSRVPLSTKLWPMPEQGNSFIGVRVLEKLADCTPAAIRLAAAALERGVTPIIMTTLDSCGFERFGFRVERLIGNETEREYFEQQLVQFWNIAIVIDVNDVVSLQ